MRTTQIKFNEGEQTTPHQKIDIFTTSIRLKPVNEQFSVSTAKNRGKLNE
jgi:hypothetical protein